jgi:glycosyltransferase involved in cell wall biosynthesis
MIQGKTITLVIPCKNEASSLATLLQKIPSYIDEVLVVDNNSTDNTRDIALKLGVQVIKELRKDSKGIGYGYAHQTGIKNAKGDIIVTMDGDGTYPVRQIKTIVSYFIKNEFDFISCSRFPLLQKHAVSWIRKLGVIILNSEVSVLINYPIKDILSGMWIVSKKTAQKLNPTEGGWNLSPEIKLKAITNKEIKFTEYHIDHNYRENGASKQQIWITGFDHLLYILKFKIDMIKRNPTSLVPALTSLNKDEDRNYGMVSAQSLN